MILHIFNNFIREIHTKCRIQYILTELQYVQQMINPKKARHKRDNKLKLTSHMTLIWENELNYSAERSET